MKKTIIIILICIFLLPFKVNGETELAKNAHSSILVEVNSGEILFEKNKDDKVSVASLTKMMSQLLILESIESGKITWDEVVTISSNAASYGGTQIYLQPGEKMSVKDLMKGISISSANDATVALAERIAGSEEKFVQMMMAKVKKLGLKNTNFVNSTGLDQEGNYSTAYDLSVIARELMKHNQIFDFSSIYEDYLRIDTPNKFWLVNTNKLVRFYEGADGLKTGFTDNAKYCMAVTSKRNNMRLLAIVLGEEISKVRNKETEELLDYGFNLYEVKKIYEKGDVLKEIKIKKGTEKSFNLITKSDITFLEKRDSNSKYKTDIEVFDIKLPIKKNQVLGRLDIYVNNKKTNSFNLVSDKKIDKKSYIKIYLNNLKEYINGKLK